nr:hypothetical protein GCM10020185_19900 [Pseudomonas brassicacearum subsp. brassicacearum]
MGSVIGSSIFNILVTLGLSALIIPLRVSRQLVRLDIPLMIGASLLVFVLAWNEELTRLDGVWLLVGLAVYLGLLLRQSRHSGRPHTVDIEMTRGSWPMSLAMIVLGLAMLIFAGHLLLGAAVEVATDLGLSERIIGLTIVAVSTSLPELATSLIAALRGQRDIAVGNVIGSNLFNLLGVLGITALAAPHAIVGLTERPGFRPAGDARRGGAVPAGVLFRLSCHPRRRAAVAGVVPGLWAARDVLHHRHAPGRPTGTADAVLCAAGPARVFLLFTSLRAWRRQHHKRDLP